MVNEVAIGKYTLESLTAGMYSSAKDLYREYIQNSVDSIDEAISQGVLKKGNERILIKINKENSTISIEDNGIGITVNESYKKLTDIGNSQKQYSTNRGFRGIGRLSGLTYCNRLTFRTSVLGENKAFIISFDCLRLRELLIPEAYSEYDLVRVLSEVTSQRIISEETKKHYFSVTLEGVEPIDGILNIEEIEDYICQVAPLPFHKDRFLWGKVIKEKFKSKGVDISEYNVFLSSGTDEKQLYKLNADQFISDRAKRVQDSIKDIETVFINDERGKLQAAIWYTLCDFNGTLVDDSIKGIRARKGNILIGNSTSLNNIFKEDRFNGWFQGEIHIIDSSIIPNARRDDFERNMSYIRLYKHLLKIGNDLSKKIRKISSKRNDKNTKVLNNAELFIKNTGNMLDSGFNSKNEKIMVQKEIESLKNEIELVNTKNEFSLSRKMDLFRKLDILANNVKGATNFKILNISQKLTIDQKKLLEKVFEAITAHLDKENADKLIGEIMKNF